MLKKGIFVPLLGVTGLKWAQAPEFQLSAPAPWIPTQCPRPVVCQNKPPRLVPETLHTRDT